MTIFEPLIGVMPEWYDDALCAQASPEDFFPAPGASARAAKSICAACPVRTLCLQWAVDNREPFGVWGGMAERERRKLWPTTGKPERTHCRNQHRYTEDNTRINGDGHRVCVSCERAAQQRHRNKGAA